MFNFERVGQHGTWVNTDPFPHTASIVDDITIVKSINTEAINHDPAITYNTGAQAQGKPSMGAWPSYGLGNENKNMPAYVVMIEGRHGQSQALYDRPGDPSSSRHQGVKFRSAGEPFSSEQPSRYRPPDVAHAQSAAMLNRESYDRFNDPETQTRISQYEMAYRMQAEAVPSIMDIAKEPKSVKELYGPSVEKPVLLRNVLLARRMAERGVRFIQLFHRGWDQHNSLPSKISQQCEDIDQPCAALIADLKQRGMFDDTLAVCGGEFGRTIYSQGQAHEGQPRPRPPWTPFLHLACRRRHRQDSRRHR